MVRLLTQGKATGGGGGGREEGKGKEKSRKWSYISKKCQYLFFGGEGGGSCYIILKCKSVVHELSQPWNQCLAI